VGSVTQTLSLGSHAHTFGKLLICPRLTRVARPDDEVREVKDHALEEDVCVVVGELVARYLTTRAGREGGGVMCFLGMPSVVQRAQYWGSSGIPNLDS
jgi:hypothetical protein